MTDRPESMFSYMPPEQREPPDHQLQVIRRLADEALRAMARELDRLCAEA